VVTADDGSYLQHYFDSRGVARLYAMTFDGRTWTLERTKPDFSPLGSCQRYTGSISDDGAAIDGEWQSSDDGQQWTRDFRLTYIRVLRKRYTPAVTPLTAVASPLTKTRAVLVSPVIMK
jgi:hypothetical protein